MEDEMEDDVYNGDPGTREGRIGQLIYHRALSDRRGFRDDQVGIPTDDPVWTEIFEEVGKEAIAAVTATP
jgi:hypothetical protein